MNLINFNMITGLLLIAAAVCLIFHFGFDRISRNEFKGKKRLYLLCLFLVITGITLVSIGIIQIH